MENANSPALNRFSNSELIASFKRLVKAERRITHLVLLHIIEVESRRLHLELGYDRMFSYLTKELGYSEYAAYERIRAAELLKKIPEISEKIEAGSLHLTQITEVQKCLREKKVQGEIITEEKTREVLVAIENKTSFHTQKYLAQEFDLPIKQHERARPQQDESVRVEITFTKEEFAELQMAKELLSHTCPSGKWSDVIITLAKKLNQQKLGKKGLCPTSVPSSQPRNDAQLLGKLTTTLKPSQRPFKIQKYRPYISIQVKRWLLKKAEFRCEHTDPIAGRCSSKYHLQIDHIQPLALGGGHDIANLRILCGAHNRSQSEKMNLKRDANYAGKTQS